MNRRDKIAALIARLRAKHADDEAIIEAAADMIVEREDENHGARELARSLGIKDKDLPELATELTAWRALGKTPDEAKATSGTSSAALTTVLEALKAIGITGDDAAAAIKAFGEQHSAMSAENATLRRTGTLREMADSLGLDFAKLGKVSGIEKAELRKVKTKVKDGDKETEQDVDTWVIPGEGEAFEPVSEYLSAFGDSLKRAATEPAKPAATWGRQDTSPKPAASSNPLLAATGHRAPAAPAVKADAAPAEPFDIWAK